MRVVVLYTGCYSLANPLLTSLLNSSIESSFMGDYRRSTRECNFDRLQPEIVAALRVHAQRYELGDIEREALICCETTNERIKKPGFFDRLIGGDLDRVHVVGIIVTPRYLLWARSGAKYGVAVLSARLRECEVLDYANTPQAQLVPDTGLEVTAMYTGATHRGQTFIGLGPEPAAQNLRQVLKEAMQQAQ